MLGYNRTITRTNIKVLLNIGPRAMGERKKEVKKQPSQHFWRWLQLILSVLHEYYQLFYWSSILIVTRQFLVPPMRSSKQRGRTGRGHEKGGFLETKQTDVWNEESRHLPHFFVFVFWGKHKKYLFLISSKLVLYTISVLRSSGYKI